MRSPGPNEVRGLRQEVYNRSNKHFRLAPWKGDFFLSGRTRAKY